MEYIFEFLLELVLEGCVEASKSSKVPKYIRYPLAGIIALFIIAVIGLLFWGGIIALKENIFAGILLILIGAFLLIMIAAKLRKAYLAIISRE